MMYKKLLATFVVVLGIFGVSATPALAHHGGDHWTVLGGDPLVSGGVWTRGEFQKLITSSKGQRAMLFARLNRAERAAITRQVRMGNFRTCTTRFGEVFEWMSFGRNGTTVDRNVMFLDPRFRRGAPSWCISAKVGGKVVTIKVPKLCANIAVPRRKRAPKPKPKPKVPIFIKKHAFVGGQPAVESFRFQLWFNGKRWKKVTIRSTGNLVRVGKIRPGNRVRICEIGIPAGFRPDGGACQTKKVGRGGAVFLFVNQKVVVPQVVPIILEKSCVDAVDNQLRGGCPTNTFFFDITTTDGKSFPNVVFNPAPGTSFVTVGQCTVGTRVRGVERSVAGWKPGPSTSWDQTVDCTPTGARLSFKNQEVPPVVVVPPPSHFTQLSCSFPPHIVANGSQFMFCVATNDNGALISLNVVGDSLITASNQVSSSVRNQAGDPCPAGAQCFRVTLFAGSSTGFSTVTARATSNGVDSAPSVGRIEVVRDDTGFNP